MNASGFAQQANYSEGQFVGYRWYDINGVAPAFPFGHGLTYGQFEYSDLSISGRNVSFTLERTAGAGCDVAQIYLAPPRDYEPHMPLKKLTHFYKSCEPKVAVTYAITDRDVSHWKVPQAPHVVGRWALTQGEWMVQVGPSSRDIRLDGHFRV